MIILDGDKMTPEAKSSYIERVLYKNQDNSKGKELVDTLNSFLKKRQGISFKIPQNKNDPLYKARINDYERINEDIKHYETLREQWYGQSLYDAYSKEYDYLMKMQLDKINEEDSALEKMELLQEQMSKVLQEYFPENNQTQSTETVECNDVVQPVELKRKDLWAKVLYYTIKQFTDEHNKTPDEDELWM